MAYPDRNEGTEWINVAGRDVRIDYVNPSPGAFSFIAITAGDLPPYRNRSESFQSLETLVAWARKWAEDRYAVG